MGPKIKIDNRFKNLARASKCWRLRFLAFFKNLNAQELEIFRNHQDGIGSVFIEMPEGLTANGIRFSSKEEMFIAEYTGHNILKSDEDGNVSIFAHESAMNQPNDIAIMDNDIIFAR